MTAQLENKWNYDEFMFPDGDYKKDKPHILSCSGFGSYYNRYLVIWITRKTD